MFTLVQSHTHVHSIPAVFSWSNQLKMHILKSHGEGTWFTCDICQKKFVSKSYFKQHLLRHDDVKPYVCSDCSKRFCTAHELKVHQTVHTDVKPFSCGLCDKYFKYKKHVKRHFKKCFEQLISNCQ